MTDQHWHHRDVAGECGLQLDPHEVVRILQTPVPCIVARISPARTNDGEHYCAVANDAVQVTAKIMSERDRIHILEHLRLAKFGHEPVIEAPCGIGVVAAAVADEDSRQGRLRFLIADSDMKTTRHSRCALRSL